MKKKHIVTDSLITKITGWIAGFIIVAIAIWGVIFFWKVEVNEETNDAQVEEYINPIISRAGGFIVAVKFEENQEVKKDDTLLLIDNREYLIQVRQTEAAIEAEIARLKVLESNVHTLRDVSKSTKAQIESSKARVWKQKLDYDRYLELYQNESATKQQLEDMEAKLEVNQSDYTSSQENYRASISKIQDIEAEKAVVNAEISRLKALLNRHELDVSYTVITASYNGRMGKRTVEVGQMIDFGQVLAFIVNSETDKWVVANYKETQIEDMEIGDVAYFTADAYPGIKFQGTIISMAPATGSSFSLLPPDNSTGNYVKIVQRIPVRIRVDYPKGDIDKLKAGMNVNVSIKKTQEPHV